MTAAAERATLMKGIGLAVAGYACFSAQDALVKWLVPHYSVFEILFIRSLFIVAFAVVATRGQGLMLAIRSRQRVALLSRAVLILAAWLSYYSAARSLPLADLVTIYFAAPIFVMVLSIVILKEKVTAARWTAALVGFAGVVLASDPGGGVNVVPVLLAVFAAFAWGWTSILVRLISRTETTTTQIVASNILFALACAVALPWVWVTPTGFDMLLLCLLGVLGGLGQFLVFEGFRHAPASAVAVFEYSALIWAFILGYAVFGDIPAPPVFAGAALIIAAGVGLLVWESRRTA